MPLDRIAAGLDDVFRLLTGGSRTVLARQQTLLASIDWSHDLLDNAERAVLRRVAVFAAPFTLDTAEAVAADGETVEGWRVLDLLSRLVDKSETAGPHPAPAVALHVHRVQLLLAQPGAEASNEALQEAHAALTHAHEIGFASRRIDALELLAVLLARRDDVPLAARLLGASQAERDRTGFRATLFDGWGHVVGELDALRSVPEFAEGTGMAVADAVELAQRSRGSRKRPSHGWDSLTPTELQVAELAAAGRRNADIGEALYMGVATVKTHLSHVFAKTGCTNRGQFAALFRSR